jgi:hypothetical protein
VSNLSRRAALRTARYFRYSVEQKSGDRRGGMAECCVSSNLEAASSSPRVDVGTVALPDGSISRLEARLASAEFA